jgi:hypothetical protein
MSAGRSELPAERDVALVELLDRALGAGVVITGDITLSLADIDLVYLSLHLMVGSVDTLFGGEQEPNLLTLGRRDQPPGRALGGATP